MCYYCSLWLLTSPQTNMFPFSSCVSVSCFIVYCELSVAACRTDKLMRNVHSCICSQFTSKPQNKTMTLTKEVYKLHFEQNNLQTKQLNPPIFLQALLLTSGSGFMPTALPTVCQKWKGRIFNRRSTWLRGLRRGESKTGEWTGNRNRPWNTHRKRQ